MPAPSARSTSTSAASSSATSPPPIRPSTAASAAPASGADEAEYLALDTLGPPTYTPPFGAAGAATDTYGHHAALLSGGARLPFGARANLELWGGALIGPRATRVTTTPTEDNQRVLFTFLLGLGLSFDLIPGPRAAPAAPAPAGP